MGRIPKVEKERALEEAAGVSGPSSSREPIPGPSHAYNMPLKRSLSLQDGTDQEPQYKMAAHHSLRETHGKSFITYSSCIIIFHKFVIFFGHNLCELELDVTGM